MCEITTCCITPIPNPTTTTTSTSSSSTTTTTTLAPTTTTTTTLDCTFTGVIDCNITTTTTTTPPPTTTTTTSYFPEPFGVPCIWSTNGGNSGNVAVYDFENNTVTEVLVPNDFTETHGIERPICATEDKLWLVSVVDQGSNVDNDNDDVVYIREWDIDATGAAPTLTYVREITVYMQYQGHNLGGTSVWAMTAMSNDRLILGTGNEYGLPAGTGGTGSYYALEFSIAASGDIIITNSDIDSSIIGSAGTNTGKLSNLTYTNSGQLVMNYRLDLTPDGAGLAHYVGNWMIVFPTTPSDPNFQASNLAIDRIMLQDKGYPEFTNNYTGVKDAPFWGVNGLAQFLHPETLEVYTIDQSAPYNVTLTTSVSSSNDWLSSATHCSNVEFITSEPDPDCGLTTFPPFFFDEEGNPKSASAGGVYDPTPQEFEYQGMTCIATIAENVNAFDIVTQSANQGFLGCSGLITPEITTPCTGIVQGLNFSITIEFPVPMNDVPLRAAVLNSNADLTSGDVYYVETNGGTPTLSITESCLAQVIGNRFGGGIGFDGQPSNNISDGNDSGIEVLVNSPNNYTSITIYGNAPTGGPLFLGCAEPPADCRLIYSTDYAGSNSCSAPSNAGRCLPGQTAFKKYFAWDINTNTQQEILLPPGTATGSPNFALSENYIIVDVTSLVTGVRSLARYGYTDVNGIPSSTTFDGQFIDYPEGAVQSYGSIMEAVTDTKFLGNWQQSFSQPFPTAVSQILEWELSGTTLSYSVKIDVGANYGYFVGGDLLLTFKTDGTPNKIIAMANIPPIVSDSQPGFLLQFDYETNALEGVIGLPAGVRGSASLGIYEQGIYIGPPDWSSAGPEFAGVWRLDIETQQWTQLESVPVEMGFPSGGPGDFAATPQCRISDGLVFSGTTTTTTTDPNITTTTTTTVPSGARTIFTHFQGIVNN
ncbi:MAG: hypothetical protein ACXAB9_06075 [Candidatus Thorarchaeota archaeon]